MQSASLQVSLKFHPPWIYYSQIKEGLKLGICTSKLLLEKKKKKKIIRSCGLSENLRLAILNSKLAISNIDAGIVIINNVLSH